jgi:hypothetical protein
MDRTLKSWSLASGQPFYLDLILKLKLKKANLGDHGLIVTALCKGRPALSYLDLILKLKLKKANMGNHGLNATALC